MSPTDGMWVYILFIAGGINVLIGYALSWPSIVAVYERTFGKKDPKTKKPTNFLRVLYVCWVILALMAAVSYLTIFVYGVVLNHGKSLEYMYLIPGMVTFMTGAIFWSYTVDENHLSTAELSCITLTSIGSIMVLLSACLSETPDHMLIAVASFLVVHHFAMDNMVYVILSDKNPNLSNPTPAKKTRSALIGLAYRIYFIPLISGIVAASYIRNDPSLVSEYLPWSIVTVVVIGLHFILGLTEALGKPDPVAFARDRWKEKRWAWVADLLLFIGLVCGVAALAPGPSEFELVLSALVLGVVGNTFCVMSWESDATDENDVEKALISTQP